VAPGDNEVTPPPGRTSGEVRAILAVEVPLWWEHGLCREFQPEPDSFITHTCIRHSGHPERHCCACGREWETL
jgi:hypothetical protein